LQTAAGFSSYTGYRVQVSVVCAGTEVGGANNNAAKRIDVTVTAPGEAPLLFSQYRGNF
ncbi:MAG: type II secretion system protein, partial [Gammaproteobacteria bacterium]